MPWITLRSLDVCHHSRVDPVLDFIERYFGVAPDNGDGSIEYLLIMFLTILIVAITLSVIITKDRPS